MTTLVSVTARAYNQIRLSFSANLDRNSALEDLLNYSIAESASSKPTSIKRVIIPSLDLFDYVDLELPNATGGGTYTVTVNPPSSAIQPITSDGVNVTTGSQAFVAIGHRPAIILALSQANNQVTAYFDEPIMDRGSTRDTGSWHFNNGLTTSSIVDVGDSWVTIGTSTQTPNLLYTLTFTGDLYDNYGNSVVSPSTASMLGFVEPVASAPPFVLPQIYNFLMEGLRSMDAKQGFLLKRYLDGFQTVWGAIVELIFFLKKNKDPASQEGTPLRFLANFIGWSETNPNTRTILDALDDKQIRSLISSSPQFWKSRGSPDAEDGLVALVTGARRYTMDWFDVRTIAGEMQTGEEHDGTDPWMVSEEEQNQYNLRIVDDGTLDRVALRAISRLCRPNGERVLITYMLFIERFGTAGDLTQFATIGATPVVSGGQLQLLDTFSQEVYVNVDGADKWEDYLVHWKIRSVNADPTQSTIFDLTFHRTTGARYAIRCTMYPLGPSNTVFELYTGPTAAVFLTAYTADALRPFPANADYVFRVHVRQVVAGIQITFYVDGTPIIDFLDTGASGGPNLAGSIGVKSFTLCRVFVDELEAIRLPAQSDFIEINT